MRRNFIALAAAAVGALAIGAGVATAQQKLKVGFVYVGPVGDFGWSYQHDEGRKAVVARYGDRVETTFVEKVSEGPDAERVIEQLARSGHKLIFTTSFGYMEPTIKVAQRFPNVWFEHATGFKRAPNVATYDARFYEGRYIIGQIAAKMSKSGTIGYIGSFPIPEVVAGINSFMLGAQSVRPDMKIKVVWVNSWYDPGKEADAAKTLISQGADIISQHTDSAAAMQVAQERGVFAFGQASDMIKFGPKARPRSSTTGRRTTSIAWASPSRASGPPARCGTASTRARSRWRPTRTCRTTCGRWPRPPRRRSSPRRCIPSSARSSARTARRSSARARAISRTSRSPA